VNKAAAEKTSQKVVTQSKTAAAAANKLKQGTVYLTLLLFLLDL